MAFLTTIKGPPANYGLMVNHHLSAVADQPQPEFTDNLFAGQP